MTAADPAATTTTRTRTVRTLHKCGACKRVVAREHQRVVTRIETWGLTGLRSRTSSRDLGVADPPTCCGRAMRGAEVKGVRSEHECGDRCLSGKGPACECECGGANHGRAYVA